MTERSGDEPRAIPGTAKAMEDGVYVHKYLGCLCTYADLGDRTEAIYGLAGDSAETLGYGLALIQETIFDAPECWEYLGDL